MGIFSSFTSETSKKHLSFTAIDVETATDSYTSICQIGVVSVYDGHIESANSYLIQPPGNEYSTKNVLIHGISPITTRNRPPFPDIWKEIEDLFRISTIVAHNCDFDITAIRQTLLFYGIEVPYIISECTYRLTNLSLPDACEAFGIPLGNHHNAISDAIACSTIYLKIKNGVIPDRSKITYKPPMDIYSGHERISGDVLKPDLSTADPNGPFFNKKVVISGVFNTYSRSDLANIFKKLGADVDAGITSRTNFLICGESVGPVKIQKAEAYIKDGANMKIITEDELLPMIKDCNSK